MEIHDLTLQPTGHLMTITPGRVPPTDPHDITLTYQHRHPWWFDADTAPEAWHVSTDIYDDSGTHVDAHAGDFHIVTVDIYDTRDPFGLLDGEDADLGLIAETVFSGGGLGGLAREGLGSV